jgi:hypothetical protein
MYIISQYALVVSVVLAWPTIIGWLVVDNCHPVFLKSEIKEKFFDGFCKGMS